MTQQLFAMRPLRLSLVLEAVVSDGEYVLVLGKW